MRAVKRIPPPGNDPYSAPASTRDRLAVVLLFRLYACTLPFSYIGWLLLWRRLRPTGIVQGHVLFEVEVFAALLLALLQVPWAFVPYRPWGWTAALVVIGFGLPTCNAVFALPLLAFWLEPKTKAAFGRL